MELSGRRNSTTFLMPRFFGFTRIDSSRIAPFIRQCGLSWVTLSAARSGIFLAAGKSTWPLIVTHCGLSSAFDDVARVTTSAQQPTHDNRCRMTAPQVKEG